MSRTLNLTRPLISFDLETTGLNVQQDRIIEMSCVKIHPDGRRETKTLRLNPEQPISPDATAVHGIHDADLTDCPTFIDQADMLAAFMQGADLTGFNIERFDLPILTREFARAQRVFPEGHVNVIDSWRIYLHFEPRDLGAAYSYYCKSTLKDAHSAEADAVAAADILVAQLDRYEELPNDAAGLHAFCHPVRPDWVDQEGKMTWQGQDAALGFGKHRGRSLREMAEQEPDYLRWISQGNFSSEVQNLCKQALMGHFPERGVSPTPAPEATLVTQAKDTPAPKAKPFTQTDLF
jgi:DNA polymerase-3 subunit epsilon